MHALKVRLALPTGHASVQRKLLVTEPNGAQHLITLVHLPNGTASLHRIVQGDAVSHLETTYGAEALIAAIREVTAHISHEARLRCALDHVTELLHSSRNPQEIIQNLVEEGALGIGCDASTVSFFVDGHWTLKWAYGLPAEAVGRETSLAEERHADLAMHSRQPVAIDDAQNDPRCSPDAMQRVGFLSVLVAPLIAQGEPFGVISFNYRHEPHRFSEAEIDYARQIAWSASIALENARLFEESVRARRDLRLREQQLQQLAETMPQMVWVTDPQGKPILFNQRWVDFTGTDSEGYEQSVQAGELIHPEDREQALHHWRHSVETGKPFEVEIRIRSKDGSHRWFLSRGMPVRDDDGHVVHWSGTATDIHDSKTAALAVRESEERMKLAADAADLALWEWNLESETVSWKNDRGIEIFGLESGQVIRGRRFLLEFVHPDDLADFSSVLQNAIEQRTKFAFRCRIRRPDGQIRWIEFTGQPTSSQGSKPAVMHGTAADVTERELAAAQLAESERRFRKMIDALPTPVYTTDAHGRLSYFNPALVELCGRTPAIGNDLYNPAWKLYTADGVRIPHGESYMAVALRTGIAQHGQDEILERPDGSRRFIMPFPTPLHDDTGRLVGGINVLMDITDRKELEDEIRRKNSELAAHSRRKDEFLAMLSHELRNPLAPIDSALHLLRHETVLQNHPNQREALDVIDRQMGNLTRMVNDLLEVARVVTGRIRMDMDTVDVRAVLRHALETTHPMMLKKSHHVHVQLTDDALWCEVDPVRLEEVLANLLNNAAKYTPPGGHVTVSAESREGFAVVKVRDNGVGIEPELLPWIFEPFTQADRSLDRSEGGLGLGLSLASGIVQSLGGSLVAASPPAGVPLGSEFTVTLPMVTPPAKASAVVADDGAQKDTVRILMVEDNADLVRLLGRVLSNAGHDVRSATDGFEGLKMGKEWKPDIALLDIGLPGMGGLDLARELRRCLGASVRLYALTGYGYDEDLEKIRAAGFDGHLIKPFRIPDLEALIRADIS